MYVYPTPTPGPVREALSTAKKDIRAAGVAAIRPILADYGVPAAAVEACADEIVRATLRATSRQLGARALQRASRELAVVATDHQIKAVLKPCCEGCRLTTAGQLEGLDAAREHLQGSTKRLLEGQNR